MTAPHVTELYSRLTQIKSTPSARKCALFWHGGRVPDQSANREQHEQRHRDPHEPKHQRRAVAALRSPAIDASERVDHAPGSFRTDGTFINTCRKFKVSADECMCEF